MTQAKLTSSQGIEVALLTNVEQPDFQPGLPTFAIAVSLLPLAVGVVLTRLKIKRLSHEVKLEKLKNQELKRKLQLSLKTIGELESNPDLVHSREFNVDYLRLRMAEDKFHAVILNQIKAKVKDKMTAALYPSQAKQGTIGIASVARQVEQIFDVEYQPGGRPKGTSRVLFRIQIKLTKIPTQPSSETVKQIVTCIENFLRLPDEHETWQPTIQNRVVMIHWDQKAMPTPLLVLEQTHEGASVVYRTHCLQ